MCHFVWGSFCQKESHVHIPLSFHFRETLNLNNVYRFTHKHATIDRYNPHIFHSLKPSNYKFWSKDTYTAQKIMEWQIHVQQLKIGFDNLKTRAKIRLSVSSSMTGTVLLLSYNSEGQEMLNISTSLNDVG